MLCGGNGISPGRIHNDDPSPGSRFDIDIIDSDSGPADRLKCAGSLNDFPSYFGLRADHQTRVFRNNLEKPRFFQTGPYVDNKIAAEVPDVTDTFWELRRRPLSS